MTIKTISIIIPIWNEEKTLRENLSSIGKLRFKNDLTKEVICIDDGSSDTSLTILKEFEKKKAITLLVNEKNLGKSQTVKKGILASHGDIVVIQDADLEYEPKDLIPMAQKIQDGEADVVYGNRYSRKIKNNMGLKNYIGNKGLTTFSNLFTALRGMRVGDMEVCYKMIRGDVARKIGKKLESVSMIGFEPEVTARLSRYKKNGKHLKVKNFPIHYDPRTQKEGKKVKYIKDGIKAVYEIIRFNIF